MNIPGTQNRPEIVKIGMFGEGMIELSGQPLQKKYGGDVLNTAIYFSRLQRQASCLNKTFDIQFITALGTDSLSNELIAAWIKEGLNTSLVTFIKNKTPGLYLVESQENGSSFFYYWRNDSAARYYFNEPAGLLKDRLLTRQLDYLYLSGISLAILTPEHRAHLIGLLARFTQKGGRVIFDNNYRPLLWSADKARDCYLDLLPLVDIAFLTDTDEKMVFGSSDPNLIMKRCADLKIREVVIKRGAQPCIVLEGNKKTEVAGKKVEVVVDACAAGDAFSAAYLFNRLSGGTIQAAATAGHKLASIVIQHAGAITPATV